MVRQRRLKKAGGLNLLRDRKMDYPEVQALAQPPLCKGCCWGSFEGKQFCSLQKCARESGDGS